MRTLPVLICLTYLLATPLTAGAQSAMYQWKDTSGVTHYSDTPPPKTKVTSRFIAPTAADARGNAPVAADKPESADCAKARLNQKILGMNGPVHAASADGKPGGVLSDADRASQRDIADQAVKAYCTPAQTPAPKTETPAR